MKDIIYKSIFRLIRFFARCFTRHYRVCPPAESVSPAVYVVHHQNLRGPLLSMIWLNVPVRPWVLHVFCSSRSCFRHYYGYTFTERYGMPKALAASIVFPLSFIVSGLMKVIEAVPVFRNSHAIVKTFKQSSSILAGGQSLLISPDIDYKDTGSNMGEMYDGFLYLEKYFMKETGRHLAFVPLHISKSSHTICTGRAVYFDGEEDFKKEKTKVYYRLKQEFIRLEGRDNKPGYDNKTGGVPFN